jgi:hypothetical protein
MMMEDCSDHAVERAVTNVKANTAAIRLMPTLPSRWISDATELDQ